MKIEVSEIKLNDYMLCPVYYQAIHQKKLPAENKPSLTKLLDKIALSFYLNLLDGKVLSPSVLKSKWDKLCHEHSYAMPPGKCLEGLSQIQKMYLWAENEELRIADVSTPYYIVIKDGEDIIEYKGEMGAVSINAKGQYELLYTDFSKKTPDQAMLDIKLKYAMDSFAFKNLFGKNAGIRIHHVAKNNDYFVMKFKEDFERMESTIRGIGRGIKNEVFYPRESIFCNYCEMKDFCRMWK